MKSSRYTFSRNGIVSQSDLMMHLFFIELRNKPARRSEGYIWFLMKRISRNVCSSFITIAKKPLCCTRCNIQATLKGKRVERSVGVIVRNKGGTWETQSRTVFPSFPAARNVPSVSGFEIKSAGHALPGSIARTASVRAVSDGAVRRFKKQFGSVRALDLKVKRIRA